MKLEIYAIKDTKIGFYNPWYQHNDAAAKRAFGQVCKEQDAIKAAPGDFELWRVGQWDDETGTIIGIMTGPEYLASGKDYAEG